MKCAKIIRVLTKDPDTEEGVDKGYLFFFCLFNSFSRGSCWRLESHCWTDEQV